jgi:adenine/guanine phosphoribosyltransferase-like PRPP-binding protein
VQEALSPANYGGLFNQSHDPEGTPAYAATSPALTTGSAGLRSMETFRADSMPSALARQLESLAHDIVATPGAGGALLAAYAAQARALQLVVEAARRGGQAPLPHAVLAAAQEALETPTSLAGLV